MKVPEDLRARVARDLRPVKPLLAPWQRLLLLVPAVVLAFAAAPEVFGLRGDLSHIGPLLAWGGSLAQLAIAIVMIAAALRESVPGEAVAGTSARLLLTASVATILLLTVATNIVSPEPVARSETFGDWYYCWRGTMLIGVPLLAVLVVLLARGLAMRPWLAGALAGMGAGAASDGGMRLVCNYSNPSHVIGSHGGAVLALTLAGVIAAVLVTSVRRR